MRERVVVGKGNGKDLLRVKVKKEGGRSESKKRE